MASNAADRAATVGHRREGRRRGLGAEGNIVLLVGLPECVKPPIPRLHVRDRGNVRSNRFPKLLGAKQSALPEGDSGTGTPTLSRGEHRTALISPPAVKGVTIRFLSRNLFSS